MADTYLTLDMTSGFARIKTSVDTGPGEAGKLVALNASGVIDPSLVTTSGVTVSGIGNAIQIRGTDIAADILPSSGQALVYDGAEWTASNVVSSGLCDASHIRGTVVSDSMILVSGQVLLYDGSEWVAGDVSVSGAAASGTFSGDATSIRGVVVMSGMAPSSGQALVYDGSMWIAGAVTDGDAASIQGRSVATTAPSDGQALVWDSDSSMWVPANVSGGAGDIPDYVIAASRLYLWERFR